MRYSQEIIDEVRERNDIVEVISERVKLTRRGSNYFGLCPFHNEKTPSFSVSPDKQIFYCFGCQSGGNVITFIMKYENYSFTEALQYLAERVGITLPKKEESAAQKAAADRRSKLLEINKTAAVYFYKKLRVPAGQVAMKYLTGRGITAETMHNFGLGYSDKYSDDLYRYMKSKGYSDDLLKDSGLFRYDSREGFKDKFWNRVMYPIMDANSRVIGFGGRVMGDGKPKYLNSPETEIFNKRRNLYGLNIARRTKRGYLIICEGYMDVISMHQAGFTNAVASLGTALTEEQCMLMKRFTKEVYILYDMDGAGRHAALRAIPMLRDVGIVTKVVDMRPCKDPDEFIQTNGKEAFEQRLLNAENSFAFITDQVELKYNIHDPGEKAQMLHEDCAEAAKIEDEIERTSCIQYLSQRYGIREKTLEGYVSKELLMADGRGQEYSRPEKLPQRAPIKVNTQDAEEKILLAMLTDRPKLIRLMKPYLSPDDFTSPVCHSIAEMVWKQSENGEISEAEIIGHFETAEEQSEAATVFHADLAYKSDEERRKAFEDVYFRMKRKSIDTRFDSLSDSDAGGFMKLMDERKKLDELARKGLPAEIFQSLK
ncbi:MAG: DNA primase [Eubacteriales bacterium]|jgi:DNA primase